MWDHYMQSVGIGWVNTLNAPPCTDGQIHSTLATNMKTFGAAVNKLLTPVSSSAVKEEVSVACPGSVELDFGNSEEINALMTREDLTNGQVITG